MKNSKGIGKSRISQLFNFSYSRIYIRVSLLLIIGCFIGNNLFFCKKSPVYFFRDSIMNINWAVCYGKCMQKKQAILYPDFFRALASKGIAVEGSIYYWRNYEDGFTRDCYPASFKKINLDLCYFLKHHHLPLWFLFLGGLFVICGFKVWVIFFAQAILGGITLWIVYFAAKKIHSSGAGLLSAFVLSSLPFFLMISRQGFLEVMLFPAVLIVFIISKYILCFTDKRKYYLFLGIVFGAGMLIKVSFLIVVIVTLFVLGVFVWKRKKDRRFFLKNIFVSISIAGTFSLPFYVFCSKCLWPYTKGMILKGKKDFFIDPHCIEVLVSILKNVELGSILFVFFVFSLIYYMIKPRLKTSFLMVFIIFGMLFTVIIPMSLTARHYILFLPLIVILICCFVMDLPKLKRVIILFLVIFSFIRGYGWLFSGFFPVDQMRYFYDEIGTTKVAQKYGCYAKDVISPGQFSSLCPLPAMRQREVYDEIKKISVASELKVVRIIDFDKYTLEKKILSGALSLFSGFEDKPIFIEMFESAKYGFFNSKPFDGRVWIFLRGDDENAVLSGEYGGNVPLKYVTSIFLSSGISCDILKENRKRDNIIFNKTE